MRVRTFRRRSPVGINMTPMIDVVFQLIIFFLVSSHLAKQEIHVQLPLPVAASGISSQDNESPRLTVNVLQDGSWQLAGRPLERSEWPQRLAEKRRAAGPQLEVRIRSDRGVPYRFIEPLMLECARQGVWDVAFAVYRPEDVH